MIFFVDFSLFEKSVRSNFAIVLCSSLVKFCVTVSVFSVFIISSGNNICAHVNV